jgi:hypothetical protein
VLDVTGTARRRQRLIGLMEWRVMAREARLVGDVLKIAARPAQMAQGALLGEDGMRSGEWAAAEGFLSALGVQREQPG